MEGVSATYLLTQNLTHTLQLQLQTNNKLRTLQLQLEILGWICNTLLQQMQVWFYFQNYKQLQDQDNNYIILAMQYSTH